MIKGLRAEPTEIRIVAVGDFLWRSPRRAPVGEKAVGKYLLASKLVISVPPSCGNSSGRKPTMTSSICLSFSPPPKTLAPPSTSSSSTSRRCRCSLVVSVSNCEQRTRRKGRLVVCMAPEEEKLTRRNPLDFPIEWEKPKPGRRPDIFPQFSPMKTPLPLPMPFDPPEEDEEEEEEEKKKEEEEEDPEKEEEQENPEKSPKKQ